MAQQLYSQPISTAAAAASVSCWRQRRQQRHDLLGQGHPLTSPSMPRSRIQIWKTARLLFRNRLVLVGYCPPCPVALPFLALRPRPRSLSDAPSLPASLSSLSPSLFSCPVMLISSQRCPQIFACPLMVISIFFFPFYIFFLLLPLFFLSLGPRTFLT